MNFYNLLYSAIGKVGVAFNKVFKAFRNVPCDFSSFWFVIS